MPYIIKMLDNSMMKISDEDFELIRVKLPEMTRSRVNFLKWSEGLLNVDHIVSVSKIDGLASKEETIPIQMEEQKMAAEETV